ncbi:MAG: PDZ domain-containing protein [Acidobacteriota bacterium]|nr:PDZ domain-containing protein [Acidobacteriota bacterium]
MQKAINIKVLTIVIGALIFSMYQETPAQRTKKTDKKSTTAAIKSVAPTINYTVSMSKPWTHLLEVEMRLDWAKLPEKAELKMPVWTPGSYLIREYARHVEDFAANDASGNILTWQKMNKNTWQIDTKGAKGIVVKYNVYANELTVRTNELNADHAFFNNAALLMFPKDQLNVPSTVKVVPFGNWKIATGLPKVEGQTNAFRAENFDVLYDSPFEIGNFKEIPFDVQGKPHRYVIEGEGNYDSQKIAVDTAKIVEEGYKIFGDLPYNDYLFILNLRGGGGLEHLNSTALQWNKFGFKPESRYRDFLTLVAHEYFHLWNVKRIKPDALGPFDYENENYTKLLWVAEGGTAYYEGLLVQRAGLMSDKDFLASKATQIQALQNRPGRFETSLENASFDAWIKYYRPDENAVNNQISYYDKGEIVNFLLDIEIRKASNGAKSLDDVMRYLYAEFAKKNKNYTPEDFQKIAETTAGKSLDDFFNKYVRGREEIDYNSILNGIGLQLTTGGGDELAYLGADFVQQGERLLVRQVQIGTPAYEQGLNANDQIIAMDGFRVMQTDSFARTSEKPSDSVKDFSTRLEMKRPGDKIRLTVFRFDELREIEITLGGRAKPDFKIVAVDNLTDKQRRLYQSYMGTKLK